MVCNIAWTTKDGKVIPISLNPYSTGIWSATCKRLYERLNKLCLNPYSTGKWSATGISLFIATAIIGLNPYSTGIWSTTL